MNTQENPFEWIEIYVKDMERAKKFYESVFQFKLEKIESPASMQNEVELWAFPMSKESLGASGALVKMKGFENNGCGVIPYFGSADCSIETKRAQEAGGKIHQEKFSIGQYGFISLIFDTEENMIGIHSTE